jgi:hypothetical protein
VRAQSQQKIHSHLLHGDTATLTTLIQSSNTPLLPLSPHQKKQSSTRLDRIKRQLLEKTDWAAVSAARPLKITFPPPEELAQFGKRRKLTDADRRRLDKTDHRASRAEVVPLFRRACLRDATPSEVGTNEGLEIRINGKRAGGSAAGGLREYNVSSQSMLLDREVSELPQTPRVEDVVSDYMPPSEYSLGVPDYHSRRTSLLSSPPGNTWISQLRYLSGYFSG